MAQDSKQYPNPILSNQQTGSKRQRTFASKRKHLNKKDGNKTAIATVFALLGIALAASAFSFLGRIWLGGLEISVLLGIIGIAITLTSVMLHWFHIAIQGTPLHRQWQNVETRWKQSTAVVITLSALMILTTAYILAKSPAFLTNTIVGYLSVGVAVTIGCVFFSLLFVGAAAWHYVIIREKSKVDEDRKNSEYDKDWEIRPLLGSRSFVEKRANLNKSGINKTAVALFFAVLGIGLAGFAFSWKGMSFYGVEMNVFLGMVGVLLSFVSIALHIFHVVVQGKSIHRQWQNLPSWRRWIAAISIFLGMLGVLFAAYAQTWSLADSLVDTFGGVFHWMDPLGVLMASIAIISIATVWHYRDIRKQSPEEYRSAIYSSLENEGELAAQQKLKARPKAQAAAKDQEDLDFLQSANMQAELTGNEIEYDVSALGHDEQPKPVETVDRVYSMIAFFKHFPRQIQEQEVAGYLKAFDQTFDPLTIAGLGDYAKLAQNADLRVAILPTTNKTDLTLSCYQKCCEKLAALVETALLVEAALQKEKTARGEQVNPCIIAQIKLVQDLHKQLIKASQKKVAAENATSATTAALAQEAAVIATARKKKRAVSRKLSAPAATGATQGTMGEEKPTAVANSATSTPSSPTSSVGSGDGASASGGSTLSSPLPSPTATASAYERTAKIEQLRRNLYQSFIRASEKIVTENVAGTSTATARKKKGAVSKKLPTPDVTTAVQVTMGEEKRIVVADNASSTPSSSASSPIGEGHGSTLSTPTTVGEKKRAVITTDNVTSVPSSPTSSVGSSAASVSDDSTLPSPLHSPIAAALSVHGVTASLGNIENVPNSDRSLVLVQLNTTANLALEKVKAADKKIRQVCEDLKKVERAPGQAVTEKERAAISEFKEVKQAIRKLEFVREKIDDFVDKMVKNTVVYGVGPEAQHAASVAQSEQSEAKRLQAAIIEADNQIRDAEKITPHRIQLLATVELLENGRNIVANEHKKIQNALPQLGRNQKDADKTASTAFSRLRYFAHLAEQRMKEVTEQLDAIKKTRSISCPAGLPARAIQDGIKQDQEDMAKLEKRANTALKEVRDIRQQTQRELSVYPSLLPPEIAVREATTKALIGSK